MFIHQATIDHFNDIVKIENSCFDLDKFNINQYKALLKRALFHFKSYERLNFRIHL